MASILRATLSATPRAAVRVAARALTGYTYATLGYAAFKTPGGRVDSAAPLLDALRKRLPLPEDNETIVRANGLFQAAAGTMLAAGVAPRLMAASLAASMVPTSLAGHAYWTFDEPAQRAAQKVQFRKNLAMMGGLLFCVLDTKPKRTKKSA